jgi:hypothetical protein
LIPCLILAQAHSFARAFFAHPTIVRGLMM